VGLTDEALALAFRTGMPYVGLRDHAHDPALDHLVPPDLARTARVIPLAADDDRIRLAVADPEPDLSALDPYLSGRQVHLALSPREELDKILGPPPVRVAEPEPVEPSVAAGPVGDEEEPAGEAEHVGAVAEPAVASDAAEPDAAEEVAGEAPLAEDLAAARDADAAEPAAARDAEAAESAEAPLTEDLAAARDAKAAADAPPAAEHPAAEEPAGAVAAVAAAPPPDDHPELAGEVPSWLEPRRRRWWVVVALIIVFLVLIAAAAVVYAYVVT
jgi:hypothetical protein